MKIGILTWFKALNHGAILQAYASQEFIRIHGHEPVVLDYKRAVSNEKSKFEQFKRKIEKVVAGDYKYRSIYYKMNQDKIRKFFDFQSTFLSLGKAYNEEYTDCTMVGSDMVFNLYQGYSDYMFGKNINTGYIFSYAASAGGSTLELANRLGITDEINALLQNFKGLGCRDISTIDFIKSICDRNDCVENIDPVLLYGFEHEMQSWDTGKWEATEPYLLVYSYNGFMNKKNQYGGIIAFARKNGLRVVSCGYFHPWCDENVNADPREFLEMFKHARFVVTDTFHGTIFSLINHIEFCSIVCGNGFKLRYLLEQCRLDCRIADGYDKIQHILNQKTDFTSYDFWVEDARSLSGNYLRAQIENAKKEQLHG